MPYHNYEKKLMGSAEIFPNGSFEVGSWQSFKIIYRAGKFGIDDQGGIMIGLRPHFDGSKLQNDDPKAEGYVTVETSTNIPVEFKIETRRSIRPLNKNIFISCLRFLKEDDQIIVRFGDKRFGSRGIRLQTFCEKKFDFKILVDPFATQDFIPLPDDKHPKISIVPTKGKIWKLVSPSLRRIDEPFNIYIKCEDEWGNPSNKISKKLFLSCEQNILRLPKTLNFKKGEFAKKVSRLKIKRSGVFLITLKDENGKKLCKSNPIIIKNSNYAHFWSDLHGQSAETIGTNTVDDYFDFGRNRSFLDICGHQGNDFQITDKFWEKLNRTTKRFNKNNDFLAIPGYEWSGNTSVGGDHNVWYKNENRPIYRSSRALLYKENKKGNDAHTSKDLIKKLKNEDAIVVAHVGGRYADIKYAHDANLEPSIEIHSAWGTFEWMLSDALKLNYKIGIVAGSDGHKGRPGASFPGDSLFGSYGGLTCHLLKNLNRNNLFESFRSRNHYATTGARIYLDVKGFFDKNTIIRKNKPNQNLNTNSCLMGDDIVTKSNEFDLEVSVVGTSPIEKIEIFDGLKLINTFFTYSEIKQTNRVRITCAGQHYRGRSRMVNWNCRAMFNNNKIKSFKPVNFWNPRKQPKKISDNTVEWTAVTTGGLASVDFWLSDNFIDGEIVIKNNFKNLKIKIKDIIKKTRVYKFGGMDIRMIISTMPNKLTQTKFDSDLKIKLKKSFQHRFYIKVTQEDGHIAWSSPIYVKRN